MVYFDSYYISFHRLTTQKQEGVEGDTGQTGSQGGGGQVDSAHAQQQQQHTQFLGDASHALPSFGNVDISVIPLPEGVTVEEVRTFEKMYREHAEVRIFFFTFAKVTDKSLTSDLCFALVKDEPCPKIWNLTDNQLLVSKGGISHFLAGV